MYERKKRTVLFQKKLHFFLRPILIISIIFIIYQLLMFIQLSNEAKKQLVKPNLILGTHIYQLELYAPNNQGQFVCIVSMEKIDFTQINDNYCDCLDGSDEPGTNACSNGQFFCKEQVDFKHYPKIVSSSKVNDGICDCCDGSDEWMHKGLHSKLSGKLQDKLQRYQSPCPKLCSE